MLHSQCELHGRISRAYYNFKKLGSTNMTLGTAHTRLQALETNWAKFEAQHERLNDKYWEKLVTHEYTTKDFADTIEETYLLQKAKFVDYVRPQEIPAAPEAESKTVVSHLPARTTLPRIQMPQFSGKYEDWPAFRDLFSSIIGRESTISNVEKLHYLKASLKDKAEQLIRNLSTTDENFNRAWSMLTEHYENKQLLVRAYLSIFTSLTKMRSESANDLKHILYCIDTTVGSLESIGRSITNSTDLFVHLTIELLDPRSRREWKNAVSGLSEPPTFSTLKHFLERRVRMLESMAPVKPEQGSTKTVSNNSNSAHSARTQPAHKAGSNQGRCVLCHKDHFLLHCPEYQRKQPSQRKKVVIAGEVCVNCLGRHALSACQSTKTCTICQEKHIPLYTMRSLPRPGLHQRRHFRHITAANDASLCSLPRHECASATRTETHTWCAHSSTPALRSRLSSRRWYNDYDCRGRALLWLSLEWEHVKRAKPKAR